MQSALVSHNVPRSSLQAVRLCVIGTLFLCLIAYAVSASASEAAIDPDEAADALQRSVQELRESIGLWAVTTEFLRNDGSVARSEEGTYEFQWIVPDRVVGGKTGPQDPNGASGILFYVNEEKQKIEMISVGADGNLWIMNGPLGGDERMSQEFPVADGGTGRLRFTRSNVSADGFESKMEFTSDGGESWVQRNHQTFRRKSGP